MEFERDEIEEFMNYLEEEKVLEWVGMSDDGERTFVFNFSIMAEVFPELYIAMMEELNKELLELYSMGFVSIEYDQNLVANFKITEEGKKYLEENGVVLPEEFQ
jgi:hypothetical protein